MQLKKEKFLKLFSIRFLTGGGCLIVFLLAYWHWLGYHLFLETPISTSEQQATLTISRGDSISSLARDWQRQGLISNQYYLRIMSFINPKLGQIKLGEYSLSPQETPSSLLRKLSEGKVIQYAFTIIEGMNSFDVIRLIKNNELIKDDLVTDTKALAESINLVNDHIEGWLFPDTYYFSRGESATKIFKRASLKMKSTLMKQWNNRAQNLPYKSTYEALIMASIIEKETGLKSEREKIAGVFVRRLNKKMRLGTDPTVIYGIGPKFNGDITYKDLRTKTPYNTYIIKGLPPTPIAMPGLDSIFAALHPDSGNALYFVADGSGGHYFSSTLEEHNKAVRRYIKGNK